MRNLVFHVLAAFVPSLCVSLDIDIPRWYRYRVQADGALRCEEVSADTGCMSASCSGYGSRDWNVDVGVPTPQLEHPQLAQSPEQEQVEQLQGDMISMVV